MWNKAKEDDEEIDLLRRICSTLSTEIAQVRAELAKAQDEGEKYRKEVAVMRKALTRAVVDDTGHRKKTRVHFMKLRNDLQSLLAGF